MGIISPNECGHPTPIPRKTKVAVIREEYVSITDKFEQALILNQFVYWTERVNDFDQFIIEENKRKDSHGLQEEMEEPTHGWIYKTASQLSEELMTGWSDNTVRKHIKALIKKGYLEERQNPKYKWSQTKQYRVDLNKVQLALFENGYSIPGFTVPKQAISNNIVKENNQLQNLQLEPQSEQVPIANPEIQDANFAIVPIIETINKETTTTSLPSSSSNDLLKIFVSLFAMIPKQYQKNSTKKIIERGLQSYDEDYIRSAIAYSVAKSTGGTWDKFNGFLGKCIDKGWGCGWEPEDTEVDKVAQDKIDAEQALQDAKKAEQDKIHKAKQDTIKNLSADQLEALDSFIEKQELNKISRGLFQKGKRDALRIQFVDEFRKRGG